MIKKTKNIIFMLILYFVIGYSSVSAKIVFLDGLGGSGKTTLQKIIFNDPKFFDTKVIFEPSEQWSDIFTLYGNDRPRWSFTAQIYILYAKDKRTKKEITKLDKPQCIIDGSTYVDKYCFAEAEYEIKNMNEVEWKIYDELSRFIMTKNLIKEDGFIYLRTSPETTIKRIKERGRPEEESSSLKSQKAIYERFENFFMQKRNFPKKIVYVPINEDEDSSTKEKKFIRKSVDVPVLVLDGDKDFLNNPKIKTEYMDKIKKFMDSL